MIKERSEGQPILVESVSFIQLSGLPYCRDIDHNGYSETIDCNKTADRLSREAGYHTSIEEKVYGASEYLKPLFEGRGGYAPIDDKIKQGENLSFDESFSLITFVCGALNRPLREVLDRMMRENGKELVPYETHKMQAAALLTAMSTKEAYVGLTAAEIAGFVAATVHIDTFTRIDHNTEYLIALGGMGGDKGYSFREKDTKFFSVSTLTALALSVDVPVHKHHSYPNKSKVAGQSAIEAMGARSDFHTPQAMRNVIDQTGLLMSSCHDTRTLHTLSHTLRGDTINHVIGPLAFPIDADTPTGALIGVNHNIHPNTMVEAMKYLQEKGFQNYVNGAVFCGTDLKEIDSNKANSSLVDNDLFRNHVMIDELAPPPFASIVSFLRNGQNLGAFVLKPEDFYSEEQLIGAEEDLLKLCIPNEKEAILEANRVVISGGDQIKARYLAMTIGLGLFIKSKLSLRDSLDIEARTINRTYLRECTQRALAIIHSGDAQRQQEAYVAATQASAGKK